MYISILGRQPVLGIAELEQIYGGDAVKWFSDMSAIVDTDTLPLERLGGTQKAGLIKIDFPRGDWRQASTKIVQKYGGDWASASGKITLGISAYGFDVPARDVQKTGILLKQKLKKSGVSLRLVPNSDAALNSATSHHNKLGLSDNKVELIVVRARSGRIVIAESIGAQNITAYTRRDQQRPKRDAFVGMLPPKLAQIMINLAAPSNQLGVIDSNTRLLDPFCGTGVVLQEAALMGYKIYGTDLSDKMVEFSQANLEWLAESHKIAIRPTIHQGDAMDTTWQPPIDVVVCEGYLGQPFSAPPSPSKLDQVRKNCNHIMSSFLSNIAPQLQPNTPLCIAIPAWRDGNGKFHHLPLIERLDGLGFERHTFKNVKNDDLLYFREDQVVARELLVLTRK